MCVPVQLGGIESSEYETGPQPVSPQSPIRLECVHTDSLTKRRTAVQHTKRNAEGTLPVVPNPSINKVTGGKSGQDSVPSSWNGLKHSDRD